MSRSVIRHKNPRGKLTHPSQGQELESAGRFTDQTKNIISSKKCEKVLYVTVIYTTEVDASLFTMDTTTPCDYNINVDMSSPHSSHENKPHTTLSRGIHSKTKHTYRNVFGDANIQYHDFENGNALTFTDKYTALLQQELKNPYWCLHDPIPTKSYQISSEMDIETM